MPDYGWYEQGPGMSSVPFVLPPHVAGAALADDLANCSALFPSKPLMLSEYGVADIGSAQLSLDNAFFSATHAAEVLAATHAALDARRAAGELVGECVHCLHDFKQQSTTLVPHDPGRLNMKGLFTRDRQQKSTAAIIRSRYERLREEQRGESTPDGAAGSLKTDDHDDDDGDELLVNAAPDVQIQLGATITPTERRFALRTAAILARQIQQRCAATVAQPGEPEFEGVAPVVIQLALNSSVGDEGFDVSDAPGSSATTVVLSGGDARGLLFGAGKFLRSSRFDGPRAAPFVPGGWRGSDAPRLRNSFRAAYFAVHYDNFCETAMLLVCRNRRLANPNHRCRCGGSAG